ncbi:MAG: cyclic nucleotide-binding domain-containing protein [Elusimicrobia bacterium]|jgi:CRP-like cAMP-binding protein|nr:cyclic nucleotide-binding domain-containing protein [Elusimicrobiota bacterium]
MPFDDTLFIKKNVNILSFFADDKIRQITAELSHQTFKKGQTVVFQGEINHNFFILKSGGAQVFAKSSGNKTCLGELKAGDFFGEISLLDSTTSDATIRSSADDTEVLMVPHDTFKRFLRENPGLELSLREKVAARARQKAEALRAPSLPPSV